MLPLYHDSCFTFRFADNRIIPRFQQGLLATATVGDGGWVDLPQPIIVRAGVSSRPQPVADTSSSG